MTEEKFEEFLRKAAHSYNAPPARTPREEMWQAIKATRAAGPRVVYGGASDLTRAAETRFGSKVWWAAAAAAVVLVAGGVGIGRWTASPVATPGSTAAATPRAPAVTEPTETPAAVNAQSGESALVAGVSPETRATRNLAGGQSVRDDSAPSPGGGTAPGNAATSAYQLAAVNHLSEAEALLISLRTRSAADQHLDAQLASWAREVLSNTRLLLDSPAAVDPQRRPLLQDLELLLVQIVQLGPGGTPQDREIIDQTLRQDNVLTRLRTAIPAGQRGS